MNAPYQVWIDHYGDGEYIDCHTITAAIVVAKLANRDHPGRVHVLGEGAEGGYDDDGQGFRDGLTESERDRLRDAGVLP